MTPGSEVETIRCLLCRGVVCFSPQDDSRYKDHLHLEHRIYYYVSWIIEKTVEENSKDEFETSSLALPSITITPVNKPVTNGNFTPTIVSIKSEVPDMADDEDESPILSVFPVQASSTPELIGHEQPDDLDADYNCMDDNNRQLGDGVSSGGGGVIGIGGSFDTLEENHRSDVIGIKEAKIITIRVEGQRVGGRKMYKCSLCPNIKPWPTIHKAERHRITHIPLAFRKMFQCPQCKERFIKEKNVKRHLDSGLCQGPKDHPCTVCSQVFESKFDLQLHEESHEQLLKRHRCHLCGAKFNKMKYLNKHILSHSNRKPYKCDICGKSFKSEYYVKTHRNAHLNDSFENSSLALENGNMDDDFEFEEHLQPEIDLIEEDPISQD